MSTDVTDTLKRHYLEHGGTAAGFEENKARLLSEYRTRATITAALAESTHKPTMNELIRAELQEKEATAQAFIASTFTHGRKKPSDASV